jgi:phosphatidate cytidylyltransferase
MSELSTPPEFFPVFIRVAIVVLFSTVMVAVVSAIRHFGGRRDDGKEKAVSSLWARAGVWVVIALTILLTDAAGPLGFSLMLAAASVVAYGELGRVAQRGGVPVSVHFGQGVSAILIVTAGFGDARIFGATLFVALLSYFFAQILNPENDRLARVYGGLGILLHLTLPLVLLVLLRFRPDGFAVVAWICLVVCFNDVMAMFGGLLVGRTPLFPRLSPAKTVEGTLLGLLGALGAAALMRFVLPGPSDFVYYGASLALALAGCAGDLAASGLKRAAGVKDFGRILPGHGGIMDRLDSLLFAVPVGYILLSFF